MREWFPELGQIESFLLKVIISGQPLYNTEHWGCCINQVAICGDFITTVTGRDITVERRQSSILILKIGTPRGQGLRWNKLMVGHGHTCPIVDYYFVEHDDFVRCPGPRYTFNAPAAHLQSSTVPKRHGCPRPWITERERD